MDSIIEYIKNHSVVFIILGVLILIMIYVVKSVLLNKLNNAKYGKSSFMAWIPVLDIFLLGRLTIHTIVGIVLVLAFLFGLLISLDIKELASIKPSIPDTYVLVYDIVYVVIIIGFFIYSKLKLNRIIFEGTSKDAMNSFINKDFSNKEPDLTNNIHEMVKPVNHVEHGLNDNFKYNTTSPLNNLVNHSNEQKDSTNNNQNP